MNSNQHLEPDLDLQTQPEKPFLYWDSLSRLAGSDGLRRYTGLVFVLPLIAAGINAIDWKKLQLPLPLAVAYGAGLCFLCGILMVQAWCPHICRDGRTAAVAKAEGRTKQYIIHQSRETYETLADESPDWANHFLHNLFAYYVRRTPDNDKIVSDLHSLNGRRLTLKELFGYCERLVQNAPDFDEAFWHVQWFAAGSRKALRISIVVLFGIGIFLASLSGTLEAVEVVTATRALLPH